MPERLYDFKPADELAEELRPFYVGYLDELRTALTLAYLNLSAGKPYKFLLFGPPGTGKSRFAWVLAYELLRAGLKPSVLFVPCSTYSSRYRPNECRDQLEDVRVHRIESAHNPIIVVFDEVDSVAGDRVTHPTSSLVAHWTLDTIRWSEKTPGPRLVISTCNYPDAMDRAILTEMGPGIYLPPPSDEQYIAILREGGVEHAREVLDAYSALCSANGAAYTGRSIKKVLDETKATFKEDWDSLSEDQIAEHLYANCGLLPAGYLEDYERKNSWTIGSARMLVKVVRPRFHALISEGKLKEVVDSEPTLAAPPLAEAVADAPTRGGAA